MSVEILYTARERREFTQATFELLLRNTNWDEVSRIVVYDDGSEKKTKFWLSEKIVACNRSGDYPEIVMHHTQLQSPPAIMNHFIERSIGDFFAKIDNDIALPPGWLDALLSVTSQNPEIELLGMEAGQTRMPFRDGEPWDGVYTWRPCSHIGGVGLMQTERFRHLPPIKSRGYFGWTEHQQLYRWIRGWIEPDLMVPQLDRVPTGPWPDLTSRYRQNGWNREWPKYNTTLDLPYYDWIPEDVIQAVGR